MRVSRRGVEIVEVVEIVEIVEVVEGVEGVEVVEIVEIVPVGDRSVASPTVSTARTPVPGMPPIKSRASRTSSKSTESTESKESKESTNRSARFPRFIRFSRYLTPPPSLCNRIRDNSPGGTVKALFALTVLHEVPSAPRHGQGKQRLDRATRRIHAQPPFPTVTTEPRDTRHATADTRPAMPHVFLSHNSSDKPAVRERRGACGVSHVACRVSRVGWRVASGGTVRARSGIEGIE